jgi:hypothetical protein
MIKQLLYPKTWLWRVVLRSAFISSWLDEHICEAPIYLGGVAIHKSKRNRERRVVHHYVGITGVKEMRMTLKIDVSVGNQLLVLGQHICARIAQFEIPCV